MNVKKNVLDLISSEGSTMINRIVASLQGKYSEESISHAIRELIEEGTIDMNSTGWVTLA